VNSDLTRLDDLALKYGTDKGSSDHNYCPHYERYLAPRREDPLTMLEIGVWEGASLHMWREYLPNATIVGLDKYDRDVQIDGVEIHIGDQDDAAFLNRVAEIAGAFDVIIDDASHISSKTIRSFELFYPHLKPGGLYVIEDLQTSYDPVNYTHMEASWNPDLPPMMPGVPRRVRNLTAMQFCKRLADEVNRGMYPDKHRLGYDLASVQFFPNIAFITKSS